MNRYIATILGLASGLHFLSAQDAALKDPILPRMPDQSAWMLEFSETAPAGQPAAPSQNRITVTKNGRIYRLVSEKPYGGFHEAWVIGTMVFLLTPDGGRSVVADMTAFPASDFSQSDFEPFQWVQSTNFSGVAEVEKRKAFVFQTDTLKRAMSRREQSLVAGARQALRSETSSEAVSDASVLQSLGWAGTFRATIDAQTQRPLSMESGSYSVRVQILPEAPGLSIPAAIQKRLDAMEREQKSLDRRPTRPR
jgi:hypothetical protein